MTGPGLAARIARLAAPGLAGLALLGCDAGADATAAATAAGADTQAASDPAASAASAAPAGAADCTADARQLVAALKAAAGGDAAALAARVRFPVEVEGQTDDSLPPVDRAGFAAFLTGWLAADSGQREEEFSNAAWLQAMGDEAGKLCDAGGELQLGNLVATQGAQGWQVTKFYSEQ